MANESRLRDNFRTGTLGSALASGDTTIDFGADPGFATLGSGEHRAIIVESEVVHLTAFTGGATTGTIVRAREGTSAAAHSSGIAWTHGPTAWDFWDNKDVEGGDLGYDAEWTESGEPTTWPSPWSWINQSGASIVTRQNRIILTKPTNSGPNLSGGARALPSESTWTATAKFGLTSNNGANTGCGIWLLNASNKLVEFRYAPFDTNYTAYFERTDPTSSGSTLGSVSHAVANAVFWLRIEKVSSADHSSYTFSWSLDGDSFAPVNSGVNVGSYITPTQIGFFCDNRSGQDIDAICHFLRVR